MKKKHWAMGQWESAGNLGLAQGRVEAELGFASVKLLSVNNIYSLLSLILVLVPEAKLSPFA